MFNFDPNNFQLEDLNRIVDQSQAAMRELERMQDALAEVVGNGSAADGLVEAEVNGTGGIRKITFNPRAMRLDSQGLAEAATEAVRAAQQDAERKNADLMATVLSGEVPDRNQLLEQFQSIQDRFARRMDEGEEAAQRRAWDR